MILSAAPVFGECVNVLKFRRFMLACFGYAALVYLLAGIPLIPNLMRMNADTKALVSGGRVFTPTESLMLFVAELLFASASVLGVLTGIAWFVLKTGRRWTRLWAIAASLAFLAVDAILVADDIYLNRHGAKGHAPAYFAILAIQTFLGIGGLLAFGRGNTRSELTTEPKQVQIASQGSNQTLDAIALILQFVGTFTLVNLYTRWGWQHGLPLAHGLESWIQWAVVIASVIFIHESAHALVGVALGMKLRAFIVGPFQFRVIEGRWTFKFNPMQVLAFSGAAGLVPVDPNQNRWNEVTMIAAGPFVNLLTGAISAAFAYAAEDYPWWSLWEYFALFAAISLMAGIVNLLPFRPDGLYSDGARIMQLFQHNALADYQRVVKNVTSTLVTARRPKDFDIAAIHGAASRISEGESALLLRLWAMHYYLDCGATADATAALAEAERIYSESAPNIPAQLHTPFVINNVLLRRDAAAAREWWQRMLNKKMDKPNGDYWLAKCAVHWAEGDIAGARDAFKRGEAHMAKVPHTGIYNFDRDCYRLMEAILDCRSVETPVATA